MYLGTDSLTPIIGTFAVFRVLGTRTMKKFFSLLVIGAALFMAACGGGGGGASGGGTDASVTTFATDNLSAGYSAVWVTINKVQLRKADDTFVTVFENSSGKVINLRALNDGANRFSLFGKDGIPSGTYSGIRVVLDRDVTLFPTGSTTGQARVFDDVYGAAAANLDLTFGSAKVVGSGESPNWVIDFDLSQWNDVAGEITNAVIVEGSTGGLSDPSRHDRDDFTGTVSSLAGTFPQLTFTLTTVNGNTINVQTNSSTAIFNNNGSPNPVLANGKRAEVYGVYVPASSSFVAFAIKVKESSDSDEFEVKGGPSEVNPSGRTLRVATRITRGFVPTLTYVNVVVNDSTLFKNDRGIVITEAQFFASLVRDTALEVEAEGTTFNTSTQTLAARKIKVDDEEDDGEAEARGTANTINATEGTFRIQLTEWEGFAGSVGMQLPITTNSGTEYRDANGETITKTAFFELLPTSAGVKVEGRMNETNMLARHARLRTSPGGGGGGGGGEAEAHGEPSDVNLSARTFKLDLLSWSGMPGSAGLQINVVMNAGATYRNRDGESITESAFFAAMSEGQIVEVEGSYNSSTQTLTGAKGKFDDD